MLFRAAGAVPPVPDAGAAALHELYAARYDRAIQLYREALKADPKWEGGYDGLVRALLEAHRAAEAFEAADLAVRNVPGTAGCLVANGRALYRKGQLPEAEKAWRAALALDQKNADALAGLARIQSIVARYKTAQMYLGLAHRLAPDDPQLMVAFARSQKGAARVATLRAALAIYDPASREARLLQARISYDEAAGDAKVETLKSGYHSYEIKMTELLDGPRRLRGVGLRVSFNGERPATLLLDTGASGISLAPRLAEKFGLRKVGEQAGEMHGLGDGEARSSYSYMASSVRVGDVEFENVPLSVFDSAKMPEADGLIGADVFARFLVILNFPDRTLTLEPLAKPAAETFEGPEDASPRSEGLSAVYRLRHMLLVPTLVNKEETSHLFLIDSGSSSNLIDSSAAHGSTKTHLDSRTRVKGLQGKVDNVSRADEGTLTFANFRQRNPDLIAIDLTKQSDVIGLAMDGILGFNVLMNLKVTIDYRDAGIRFEYQAR